MLRETLGGYFLKAGKPEEALTQFNRALALDPENRSYLLQRGESFKVLKRFEEAEQSFRRAWNLDKEDYAAPRALASLLFETERVQEAHQVLDASISADGKVDFQDFICIYDKLHFYLFKNDVLGLKSQLGTIVKIATGKKDKEFAAFMLGRSAYQLYEVNAYDIANTFLETARTLDPHNEYLANLHDSSSRLADLETETSKVLHDSFFHDLVQEMVRLFVGRATGHIQDDDWNKRFAELQDLIVMVMDRDPDSSEVKRSLHRLKTDHPKIYDAARNFYDHVLAHPPATHSLLPCPYCFKKILVFKMSPGEGSCPHCNRSIYFDGKSINQPMTACFVATAVYGSEGHPDVEFLRSFRDRVLLQSIMGRSFIEVYYILGPDLARWIKPHRTTKRVLRWIFAWIVREIRARTRI